MQEYQEYAENQQLRNVTASNKNRWLAILNLILATGSIFSHMVNATWKGAGDDHLVFFSKARLLSLNNGVLAVPDIMQVQAFALASTYLLASNQTNRLSTIHVGDLSFKDSELTNA